MDNFFRTCPPKMEDQGRHLTNFQSSAKNNEYIKYVNDIYRDDQYRVFLQQNGKQIMDREWQYHNTYNRCWVNDCIHTFPTRVLPQQMAQERILYDSMTNPATNQQFFLQRQCTKLPDYRMTSDTF